MTAVLTAFELHGQMVERANEVDAAVKEYRLQAKAYAQATHDSEMAQALARPRVKKDLGPKATVGDIEAAVYLMCAEQALTELQADALRNGADRALKAAMAQLSALQSMAAALREEIRLTRVNNFD